MLPAVGTTPDSRDLRRSKEASVELRLRKLNSLSFIRKSDLTGFFALPCRTYARFFPLLWSFKRAAKQIIEEFRV